MLNPKALGLTLGVLSGLFWLVAIPVSLWTGLLDQTLQGWGALHPRFSYTYGGAVWMAVMHLVGGFVWGYVIAWTYNKFLAKGM